MKETRMIVTHTTRQICLDDLKHPLEKTNDHTLQAFVAYTNNHFSGLFGMFDRSLARGNGNKIHNSA